RQAKAVLAYEATKLVHGEEEAQKAERGAKGAFAGGSLDDVPTSTVTPQYLQGNPKLPAALVEFGLAATNSAARRLIEQGGVSVNDEKADSVEFQLTPASVVDGQILIRVGKKKLHRVLVSPA